MSFKRLFDSENKRNRADPQQEETPSGPTPAPSKPSAAQNETAVTVEKIVAPEMPGPFYEKDNRAFRIQRLSQANDFLTEYEKRSANTPFLKYVFDSQLQAIEALLSISCIHRAEDTGHLICTAPITLGCYRIIDGRYEVFLAGEKMTASVFSEATEKFSSHRGKYRNQLKPETYERFKSLKSASEQLVFKKEYYQLGLTDTKYYQIFEAPNTHIARAFLFNRDNVIMDKNRYIHVETPEGTICGDASGVHELDPDNDSGRG